MNTECSWVVCGFPCHLPVRFSLITNSPAGHWRENTAALFDWNTSKIFQIIEIGSVWFPCFWNALLSWCSWQQLRKPQKFPKLFALMGIFTCKVTDLLFSLFPDSFAKLWLSSSLLLLPDLPFMPYSPSLLFCILPLLLVACLLPAPHVQSKLSLSDTTTVTDPPCSTVVLRGGQWHVLGMCCLLALVHKEMNKASFPFVKTQILPCMSPVLQGGTWGWQWAAEVVV